MCQIVSDNQGKGPVPTTEIMNGAGDYIIQFTFTSRDLTCITLSTLPMTSGGSLIQIQTMNSGNTIQIYELPEEEDARCAFIVQLD